MTQGAIIWAVVVLPMLGGGLIWAVMPARGQGVAAAAVAAATAALAWILGGQSASYDWAMGLPLSAALPPLATFMAVTVPLVALPILLFSAVHEQRRGRSRLIGLLLIFVGGIELVAVADDLLTLLIGWEFVGACSWALIGHFWRAQAAVESATYAFLMTRTGDLGLFLALFAAWGAGGDLSYDALGGLSGLPLSLVAAGVLLAALSKSGQVPFSTWLFRAMDGPTSVSALLHSAAMVAAGVYLLARLWPELSGAGFFGPVAMVMGLGTALAGGVVALTQVHAKKVLAGSTSAQMGLMIAAVGAGFPGVAMLHLLVHAATKAALFLSVGIAHDAAESFDLRRMRLGRSLGFVSVMVAIAALSLAAVPPLSGGWTKEEITGALHHAGPLFGIAVILAGALSAGYATRLAWMAYGPGERRGARPERQEVVAMSLAVLGVLVLSLLWFPDIHEAVARGLRIELPDSSLGWAIASLIGVAAGIVLGLLLSRNARAPEHDWLGLPAMIDRLVTAPTLALAGVAGRADDAWIDMIPRGVARAGRGVSARFDRLDGHDVIPGGSVGLARALSGGADRAGLPEQIVRIPSAIVADSARQLRRMQTGLAHHYYLILVLGTAVGAALLIFGA